MYNFVELFILYLYRVHIRRTDKVGTEAAFHKLEEYMAHVELYFKHKELSEKIIKKRVYLATDEPKLFSEAKEKYVLFIYYFHFTSINVYTF